MALGQVITAGIGPPTDADQIRWFLTFGLGAAPVIIRPRGNIDGATPVDPFEGAPIDRLNRKEKADPFAKGPIDRFRGHGVDRLEN